MPKGNLHTNMDLTLLSLYVNHFKNDYKISLCSLLYEHQVNSPFPDDIPGYFYDSSDLLRYFSPLSYMFDTMKKDSSFKLYKRISVFGRKFFLRKKPVFDCILCMKDDAEYMAVADMIPANKKIVFIHTDYRIDNRYIDTQQIKKFDHAVCVCEQVREGFISTFEDTGNLIVRYNPIPADKIIAKSHDTSPRQIYTDTNIGWIDPGRIKFVMIGQLREQKGYDILLDALKRLNDSGYGEKYIVLILGGEPENSGKMDELKTESKNMGIDNIYFAGHMDNPYPVMSSADWFLSTSRFEGQSIAMQEAIILGLPLIITNAGGVEELLMRDRNDPDAVIMDISAESIYENMKNVIDHPELKDKYIKKSRKISKEIDFDHRIKKIEELLT